MTLSVVYLLIWRNGFSFAFSVDACPWQDFGREEYDFSLRPAQSFKTRKNLSYLISSVWGSIYYFGNLSPLYFSHMFFKRQRFCPHLPVCQHIFFPRLCFFSTSLLYVPVFLHLTGFCVLFSVVKTLLVCDACICKCRFSIIQGVLVINDQKHHSFMLSFKIKKENILQLYNFK